MTTTEKGKKMAKTNTAKKTAAEVETEIPQDESPRILEDVSKVKAPTEQKTPLDDKGRLTEIRYSMEQLEGKGLKNKSQVIRFLLAEKYAPAAIARFLGVRYQFVRNVSVQPLKRQTS